MASTLLTKNAQSVTNAKKYTVSFWCKKALFGINQYVLNTASDGSNRLGILFNTSEQLEIYGQTSGSENAYVRPTRLFRDPNSFYHFVIAVDTTQSTAADRVKIYVNGTLETVMTSTNYPSQNADLESARNHYIGGYGVSANYYFGGVISHFHFVDGTQYAASDFGETDSTTGEWKIKTSPSVTYGSAGYFILKDGNSVTDQSGNSNNFAVSTGTLTNTEDCPSNVFCTINALNTQISGLTIGNGNTSRSSNTGDAWRTTYGTLAASSGKFYWEQKVTGSVGSAHYIGITDQDENRHSNTNDFENANVSAYCYRGDGGKVTSVSGSTVLTASAGASFTNGDIIGVAIDLDNQKIYFSKNGTWQASGDPTSGSTGTGSFFNITAGKLYTPATACYHSGAGYQYNFGNGSFGGTAISSEGTNASSIGKFEYDVPTGYTALSTKGLNE